MSWNLRSGKSYIIEGKVENKMAREADILKVACCPFCKEEQDLELNIDENIIVCYNCGRNFKVIVDNLKVL